MLKEQIFFSDEYGQLLHERFSIPVQDLPQILLKLNNANQEIKRAFLDVLQNKEVDLTIEQISYELLTNDLKMTPLAALLTLDWLMREPEKALKSFRKDIIRWKSQDRLGKQG